MKWTFVVIVSLLASLAAATPPALDPGTCTYLVGAPTGATAASDVETFEGTAVTPTCLALYTVSTRATEPNSVQLHFEQDPRLGGSTGCFAKGWVGHEFAVTGSGRALRVAADVAGGLEGRLASILIPRNVRLRVAFVLEEWDSLRAEFVGIGETVIFDRDSASAPQDISERFANRIEALVTPGRRYRAALVATSETHHQGFFVHFGPPATGRGVWYDSISVCIDAPDDPSAAILARLDTLELADLEGHLYERQCLPRVWMPEAQGGQLARARDLVQLRLNQAIATGDTGVNARVAAARLVSADASIVAGQYQRACRELSEGLRALTTP